MLKINTTNAHLAVEMALLLRVYDNYPAKLIIYALVSKRYYWHALWERLIVIFTVISGQNSPGGVRGRFYLITVGKCYHSQKGSS